MSFSEKSRGGSIDTLPAYDSTTGQHITGDTSAASEKKLSSLGFTRAILPGRGIAECWIKRIRYTPTVEDAERHCAQYAVISPRNHHSVTITTRPPPHGFFLNYAPSTWSQGRPSLLKRAMHELYDLFFADPQELYFIQAVDEDQLTSPRLPKLAVLTHFDVDQRRKETAMLRLDSTVDVGQPVDNTLEAIFATKEAADVSLKTLGCLGFQLRDREQFIASADRIEAAELRSKLDEHKNQVDKINMRLAAQIKTLTTQCNAVKTTLMKGNSKLRKSKVQRSLEALVQTWWKGKESRAALPVAMDKFFKYYLKPALRGKEPNIDHVYWYWTQGVNRAEIYRVFGVRMQTYEPIQTPELHTENTAALSRATLIAAVASLCPIV